MKKFMCAAAALGLLFACAGGPAPDTAVQSKSAGYMKERPAGGTEGLSPDEGIARIAQQIEVGLPAGPPDSGGKLYVAFGLLQRLCAGGIAGAFCQ